ncbi:UNVERIFIED_CONTAM: hypothetical protein NCL1_33882 [Trichonephila clavipes]
MHAMGNHNNLAPVRVSDLRFEQIVPLVKNHPVIYFILIRVGIEGALSLKLESPCYSYGVRFFDDITILQRRKDETVRSPTTLCIVGMYVTIYVTVVLPFEGVSFVFLSQASAAPFAITDSGLVRMDSSCVSSQPGRVSSCWVPCFYYAYLF